MATDGFLNAVLVERAGETSNDELDIQAYLLRLPCFSFTEDA
jgi:hypothetical protein